MDLSIANVRRFDMESGNTINTIQMKNRTANINALYHKYKSALRFIGQVTLAFSFLGASLAIVITLIKHFQ